MPQKANVTKKTITPNSPETPSRGERMKLTRTISRQIATVQQQTKKFSNSGILASYPAVTCANHAPYFNLFNSHLLFHLVRHLFLCLAWAAGRWTAGAAAEAHDVAARVKIEVEEVIGRLFQLRRSGAAEGDDFHLAAAVGLEVLHQGHEIAISRDEDDGIELGRCRNGINCQSDVPIGLLCAAIEDLEVFETHFDADFGKGFKKAFFFATLRGDGIRAGANEATAGDRVFKDIAEIRPRVVDVLRAVVDVLRVDKDADALFWVFDN